MSDEILTFSAPRWDVFIERLAEALSVTGLPDERRCHGDHRVARAIMGDMGDINIEASVAYFKTRGGFCDCEVVINTADPELEDT